MKWNNIKTAPKDGTKILLTGICAFPDEGKRWYGDGFWKCGDWYSGEADWEEGKSWYNPTHWTTLPLPPKGERK